MTLLTELPIAQLAQNPSFWLAFSALFLLLAPLLFYLHLTPSVYKDSRRRHLPPGPKGLPFIGNLLDLSDSNKVPSVVRGWAEQYGDVFYTKIGGTDYVWLSSPEAVKELMDKRSSIYSSRPILPLAQDVASAGRRQLFMQYGPRWRSLRKMSHALLNSTTAASYQPVQDFESKQLMLELLRSPQDFYQHNRRYAASVIMLVAYGYRLPQWEHPLVKKIFSVLDNLTEMTAPGAHAVDSFPSLRFLPQWMLGNWRSFGQRVLEHDSNVYMDMWQELTQKVDQGTAAPCFCKDFYLKLQEKDDVDPLLAAYTCGGLVEAGSETTATTLNNFLLAMVLFPEALRSAQEELDRVVGSQRLPTWSDEQKLPYIRALVKEVLRWRAVNKFGMVHASSEDDWYQGMFIPKGSVVVLNWWAIHMNSKIHEDPETFDPKRYLGYDASAADLINANDPNDRDHFSYGAGRRVCPGVHVAERSLFINIARTLWGFNVCKATDPSGDLIEPETEMVRGFLSVPKPFRCSITVRSATHGRIIEEEFAKASAEGLHW